MAPSASLAAPVLIVIAGVGLTVMDIAGRTILQRGVDDGVLARVFGILEGLANRAGWEAVPAGAVIIREGDTGERFYILESGSVAASKDGRFLRRLSRPGDSFGEIALLRDIPRTASVVAEETAVMLVLDRPGFLAAVTGNPAAAAALARVAGARIEDRDP